MRAATIRDRQIVVAEHPDPAPGAGEVLVRVRAAGLNGADQIQKKGHYPPPPGSGVPEDIPGLEIAGEVIGLGPGAGRFGAGDRVMAVVAGAGQAELAVVHERQLMPVPDSVSWEAAGGFPEVFVTAFDAVVGQGDLRAGDRLLVHGAAGGVGTAAIQIGVVSGATVTATVRNPANHDAVAALGATVVSPEGFGAAGPFEVVLELVGGVNLPDDVRALATGGRVVVIGMSGGLTAELNLADLVSRRGRISGSTLRARPLEEKSILARAIERHLLPHLGSGRITVPIAATFPLEEAAAAYDYFAAGGKFGKVVLTVPA